MGRFPISRLVPIAIIAFAASAFGQPEEIYGTRDGAIELFTPTEVVKAGGGGGGETTPLSDQTPLVDGTAAAGTATAASRGDHVHPARAIPGPSSADPAAPGTAAPGTATTYSRGDHVHPPQTVNVPAPSSANPAALGTASPGTATAYSRGDHVHPEVDIPAPSNTAGANLSNPAIAGTSKAYARGDHTHLLPTIPLASPDNPAAPGTASPGTNTRFYSRSDHVHPLQAVPQPATTNGTAPGTAAPGTATTYSRGDHVHPGGCTIPQITGQSGRILSVNSGGSGCEWRAASGGSGADAELDWRYLDQVLSWNTDAKQSKALSGTALMRCLNAELLAVHAGQRGAIGTEFAVLPPATTGEYFVNLLDDSNNFVAIASVNRTSTACTLTLDYARSTRFGSASFYFANTTGGGGGGGGGTGPTIPNPVAGAAEKTLRVNAAGAAYEFGVIAADAGEVQELSDSVQRDISVLEAQTSDLSRVQASNYVLNTDSAEGVYIGASIPDIEPTWRNTIQPPYPLQGRTIWARLKTGSDPLDYQVAITLDNLTDLERGATWIRHARPSLTHHYYQVVQGFSGLATKIELQVHSERAGTTEFAGKLTGSDFTTLKGRVDVIEPKVTALDSPARADAGTGSVLTADCGSDPCSVAYKALPSAFRYEGISSGQFRHSGGGQATQSFAQTGGNALFHNHIISGRYQELRIHVTYVTIIPSQTRVQMCVIPGVAPDLTLNATRTVVANGSMPNISGGISSCYLTIPATGNVTITFGNIGEGGLNTDFRWNLYGIRWP